jgi:hypothetical protein
VSARRGSLEPDSLAGSPASPAEDSLPAPDGGPTSSAANATLIAGARRLGREDRASGPQEGDRFAEINPAA